MGRQCARLFDQAILAAPLFVYLGEERIVIRRVSNATENVILAGIQLDYVEGHRNHGISLQRSGLLLTQEYCRDGRGSNSAF